MKRKEVQEILEATKPQDIFTMDLEIIEQEKEAYLSKYKPGNYKTVQNKLITRTIMNLYNQGISILEGNDTTQENYANINFDANYKLAEEILDSSQKILNEIGNILDKDEKKNLLEEYYMLRREIMGFEDKLIEMNVIKKVYEKMSLEKQDEIEMTDKEILFLLTIFSNYKEKLEKITKIIKTEKISPVLYIIERIRKEGIGVNYGDEELIIWLRISHGYLVKTRYKGDIPINVLDRKSIDDNFILQVGKYEVFCEPKGDFYFRKALFEDKLIRESDCLKFRTLAEYSGNDLEIKKFDKNSAEELLQIAYNLWEKKRSVTEIDEEYNVWEFKNLLKSINMDIKMNNLRNLHSELSKAVRHYKFN